MTAPRIHPESGRPQAMAERCGTCILRPGGSGLVAPEVVRDLVARHREVGSVVTCHKTLPGIPGYVAGVGYSACRGFLDAYPDTLGARVVEPWFGGWHLVHLPDGTEDACTCIPCTEPQHGAPGVAHCAACCAGTGVEEYDPQCPDAEHREMARRQHGG